jgi:hypothetical protein
VSTAGESKRPRWETVSAITAVVSLIGVLTFNSIQVSRDADQATQSRAAAELGLSTQLHSLVTEAENAVNATDLAAKLERNEKPTRKETAALRFALASADYLAWLLNRGYVNVDGAREYWAPVLGEAYDLGKRASGELDVDDFVELSRFVREAPQ